MRATVIAVEPLDVDDILDRHRERFRALVREIVEEERGESPLALSLAEYLSRSSAERALVFERAATLLRDRVESELARRGATWLVFVDGHVVLSSNDRDSLPSMDEVLALGRASDRVPFLFEAPLIEELASSSDWSAVESGIRGDRYPTIPLEIMGLACIADLDTGSHGTFLDDSFGASTSRDDALWFIGHHLGRQFYWSPDSVRVRVRLGDGSERDAPLPIRRVRSWASSPFVRLNPLRRMLAGRDLLRGLHLALDLRAAEAATTLRS